MKTALLTLSFSLICAYSANAQSQAVSSQKQAQVQQVNEPAAQPAHASGTATLVSGAHNAVVTEVPLENKPEGTEQKTEAVSSKRTPK